MDSNHTNIPKYMMLVNWIREQLESRQIGYGDKFYSENELSAMFNISRQTVRQAIGILEQEKIVERRRGSGTYIVYSPEVKRIPTRNIGVISTYLDDYIFPSIIHGIESVLTESGYSMQLAFTHNRVENEARALRTMLEKDVDGIIVEPAKSGLPTPNQHFYNEIREKRIPLIFFNAYYPNSTFPHVALNDQRAGRLATEFLINAGHRKIAGLFQSDDLQGHLRYAGYMQALMDAGIESSSHNILWYTTEDWEELQDYGKRILSRLEGCTGVFCYNDQLAFQLVGQLKSAGFSVPDDISVVSVDNSDLASVCEVPLTSVAHPKKLLGETVARNLLSMIADPQFHATVDFEPGLAVRKSVKSL